MVKPGSQGSAQLLLSKSQLLRDVPAFLKAHLLPSLSPWIITDTPPPGRQTRSAAQIKEQFGSKLLPFLSLSHPFKSELLPPPSPPTRSPTTTLPGLPSSFGPSRKSRLLHPPKLSHCVPSSGLFLIYSKIHCFF